ncbi:hypothetical protein CBW24_08650 [Pacificitalea manganoxidans]|uniref:Uncharacterized protein n=1 Tax=Pacificitalea manganoxidans TaxID=1411902 RepID=A0A291LZH4_9RHOB|nr:hypothetical protein CBW24_08650 [Pacificitalea manganoxidans]
MFESAGELIERDKPGDRKAWQRQAAQNHDPFAPHRGNEAQPGDRLERPALACLRDDGVDSGIGVRVAFCRRI